MMSLTDSVIFQQIQQTFAQEGGGAVSCAQVLIVVMMAFGLGVNVGMFLISRTVSQPAPEPKKHRPAPPKK